MYDRQWYDAVWNPWAGCADVGPECQNCYVRREFAESKGEVVWGPAGTRRMTRREVWNVPYDMAAFLRPPESCRLLTCSLGDFFEDWRGDIIDTQQKVITRADKPITMGILRNWAFKIMRETPEITYLIQTRRPQNILRMLPAGRMRNIWIGITAGCHDTLAESARHLIDLKQQSVMKTGVEKVFLVCEPLIGPINLNGYGYLFDWVICGGESGKECRKMNPSWAKNLLDQCEDRGIPFFMHQMGGHPNRLDQWIDLDPRLMNREFPE